MIPSLGRRLILAMFRRPAVACLLPNGKQGTSWSKWLCADFWNKRDKEVPHPPHAVLNVHLAMLRGMKWKEDDITQFEL